MLLFLKLPYQCFHIYFRTLFLIFDIPVAAGRLDLVLEMNKQLGLGDIKRTSVLDKEYLAYQLNLYRIGYFQSYGKKAEFLVGLHLRERVRKFVELPISEDMTMELVNEYLNYIITLSVTL